MKRNNLGSLSSGATSGSGTDRYMVMPSGCSDIPDDKKVVTTNTPYSDYPSGDFTPECDYGRDKLFKTWNGGDSYNMGMTTYPYDIPEIDNMNGTNGQGYGDVNTDTNYGSYNTTFLVAITNINQGGVHAAAQYCDKLVFGGYSDWYLPNRYELHLLASYNENFTGFSGQNYWSSSERSSDGAWSEILDKNYRADYCSGPDYSCVGLQEAIQKVANYGIRCVRRF